MAPRFLCLFLVLLAPWCPLPAPGAPPPSYPSAQVARQRFELADRDMNVHWNSVRKTLPPGEYRLIQESQRRWALIRDEMCASPIFTATGGETRHRSNSGPFLQTAADLTEQRGKWLKGVADFWNQSGLSGVWEDGEGGRIEVLQREGYLAFSIETVRGVASNTGALAGVAVWDHRVGWYSTPKGASFCLLLRQNRLELVSSGPSPHHHPEAGFDGNYYRTRELPSDSSETLERMLSGKTAKPAP